jgi:small subunit ribosomal protein S20
MANIKSKIKRIGTNEKSRVRNLAVKSELKSKVRSVREAVTAKDKNKALDAYRKASQKLDIAVSKGVIHKNQAANRKSKLVKKLKTILESAELNKPVEKAPKKAAPTKKTASTKKAAPKKATTKKAVAKKTAPAAKSTVAKSSTSKPANSKTTAAGKAASKKVVTKKTAAKKTNSK